jgi:(2R)-ethylmalonyl-CoA mutase
LDDVPVVVGGIIPEHDAEQLRAAGVARVFTPKDFEITDVLGEIVDAIEAARS